MDSIFIDDSTTTYYLAKYIAAHPEKPMSVVTNSLAAASLANLRHIELFMLGGHIIGTPPAALDNISQNDLEQFYINKAFVGSNGIDFEYGITSIGLPQKNIKQKIISIAKQTYVLVDSSKFGNRSLFPVCSINKLHKIITDNELSSSQLNLSQKEHISVDIV